MRFIGRGHLPCEKLETKCVIYGTIPVLFSKVITLHFTYGKGYSDQNSIAVSYVRLVSDMKHWEGNQADMVSLLCVEFMVCLLRTRKNHNRSSRHV